MQDVLTYRNQPLEFIELLSKSHNSHTYLVKDGQQKYIVKKILESDASSKQSDKFTLELDAYEKLSKLPINIPKLLEVNHEQKYLIKEYISGELLSHLAACGDVSTETIIQCMALSEALRKSDLNVDYFPKNFILSNNKLYYIDYEVHDYFVEWGFTHWGIYYWLNQEGMKLYIETGDFDLLHPDPNISKPRTLGFEMQVAQLKALYQKYKLASK